jgi:hypothetical protein
MYMAQNVVQSVPEIITAAAKSPLGVAALIIVALSLIGLAFFRNESANVKIAIYVLMFIGFICFGVALIRTSPAPPTVTTTLPPSPTPKLDTPPVNFAGKFAIPLETDEKLSDARINVEEKGKANSFTSVYILKDADGYKTVAVFDSREKAKENLPFS